MITMKKCQALLAKEDRHPVVQLSSGSISDLNALLSDSITYLGFFLWNYWKLTYWG